MNDIRNPQIRRQGIAETSFKVGDRVKLIYLPGAVKNKNLTEQMEGFVLEQGIKRGKMTVAKVVLDNGQQYLLDAEWLEKSASQQKDDSTAPNEPQNSKNFPISLEKQPINEFSRKLLTPRYSPHYQRWVSTGFETEIGWQSQPVPAPIQEAVRGHLFRINDSYASAEGEVALIGREVGNYAVLAVATREIDSSTRPLVGYRYFWLEKPTSESDGVGTLLNWWQEAGQPTFHLVPERMQEEYVKPKWAIIREEQPVSSFLKEPETLPHVLFDKLLSYQDLHALSVRLKEQYDFPVAWAWNVQCLGKPDVFNLIGCRDENSAELNAKYIKRPRQIPEKKKKSQ